MQKEIVVRDQAVAYTLKRSRRARRVRLAVYHDGSVVITAPYGINEAFAERFIREKSQWLFSKIAFFKKVKAVPVPRARRGDYKKYKEQAYELALARLNYFSGLYQIPFGKVTIRNQKTRWGSCSRKGNLNFNYKLVLLPPRVADYIIVHELCHIKEFNHSKKFWTLVAQTIPEYRALRRQLRRSGLRFS